MACTACRSDDIKKIPPDEWIPIEQVKDICPDCYQNMLKNNIKRIKAFVLAEKIGVKLFEIIYTGPLNHKLNIPGHTLFPFEPLYLEPNELPLPVHELKKIPDLKVEEVFLKGKPEGKKAHIVGQAMMGKKGVIWVGASPKRHNEYGIFPRDKVVYVTPEVADALMALGGFEIAKLEKE